MEPKRPRSKTVVFVAVIVIVLIGFGFYYVTALRNSDAPSQQVERQS